MSGSFINDWSNGKTGLKVQGFQQYVVMSLWADGNN